MIKSKKIQINFLNISLLETISGIKTGRKLHYFLNPVTQISKKAILIHGLTNEKLKYFVLPFLRYLLFSKPSGSGEKFSLFLISRFSENQCIILLSLKLTYLLLKLSIEL